MERNAHSPAAECTRGRLKSLRTATRFGEQRSLFPDFMKLARKIDESASGCSAACMVCHPKFSSTVLGCALASHTDVCERSGVLSVQEGQDVGRVTSDARTMSAMVTLTQEIDESCVVIVGYGMVSPLSPRPADCGMPVCVSFQEKAGYKLETFATRCADVGVLSVVATDTKSAMVKLAQKTDESASDVVGVDVSPRPWPSWCLWLRALVLPQISSRS